MTTKTTTKTMIATGALALGLLGAGPARAWEPDPLRPPGYYTGVVRVLDFAMQDNHILVALTDEPGALCAAQQTGNAQYLAQWAGPAWVPFTENAGAGSGYWGQWLSTLLWAKSQNIQVRVFLRARPAENCIITHFRTCADAAACAYPPPPAGP
ncbi:hypothetical protein L6V77_31435 [Myxococcota bacterium]|nr:hypothetical protein [Myxococcota bacterium]